MIVVDTSALMAVLLNEDAGEACREALVAAPDLMMSAATLTEAMIVASGRNLLDEIVALIDGLAIDISPVTAASARRCADVYRRWGKGHHKASLNFGDCFAYELAASRSCPLLFVGSDFASTDVASVL